MVEATELARAGKLGTEGHPELRIVLGNTSYDMDSCVGSLSLAWYYTVKTEKLFLPLINCKRTDFKNKLNIAMHLLEDCKLP